MFISPEATVVNLFAILRLFLVGLTPVEVNLLAVSSKPVQRSEENKLGRRKHLQALRHWYGNNRIAPPYY